jgi:t-SNARE complex subunit (syntaxin)
MYETFFLCNSYVRLELLEGVVAYHNGHTEKALDSISSAKSKYMQVYVLAVIIL